MHGDFVKLDRGQEKVLTDAFVSVVPQESCGIL